MNYFQNEHSEHEVVLFYLCYEENLKFLELKVFSSNYPQRKYSSIIMDVHFSAIIFRIFRSQHLSTAMMDGEQIFCIHFGNRNTKDIDDIGLQSKKFTKYGK